MSEEIRIIVDHEHAGERLDVFLSHFLDGFSRSFLQKKITEGCVLYNGKGVKSKQPVKAGDEILLAIPDPEPAAAVPENIPLEILYEDEDLLFVNKPKGLVVHPAPGHETGTLVNALVYYLGDDLSSIGGVLRPGIVHRIDMDTSGVLVIAKNDIAHRKVAEQLAVHSIRRRYRAIVHGRIEEESGTISKPIGRSQTNRLKMAVRPDGKRAVTHFKVLQRFDAYTYIECSLETGRTHQIRVHMTSVGHPLLGDTVYGNIPNKFRLQGQTLHALSLGLVHPRTGEWIEVTSDIPDYMKHLLEIL